MTKQINEVTSYLLGLQSRICSSLEEYESNTAFQDDLWEKSTLSGGGLTKVLEGGDCFEKAGVNYSNIQGDCLPKAATDKRPELAGRPYQATGVSLVIHPRNPFVPTTHANFRYFTTLDDSPIWWFGGGYDLTPYYGFVEDCQHWHQSALNACTPFGADLYPKYKAWCDDYFYLPHRDETRGIGGLFFDDINEKGFDDSFSFIQSVGNSFIGAYLPIVTRRKDTPYTEQEKAFQCYRRGRYVEFNLVYDRGTLFGLQSRGRTESILMSLPPEVNWRYNWQPEPGSAEERLYKEYLVKREWLGE